MKLIPVNLFLLVYNTINVVRRIIYLLEHLGRSAKESATQVRCWVSPGATETVLPAANVSGLSNDLKLIFMVRDNLCELFLDILRIDWLSTDTC
jgi:hypothetical protein